MNRVEVSGRLTRDPEVRYVGESRFPILSLNVAVDNGTGRFNRDTRKTEYESGFYAVEAVGQYGEALERLLSKGDEVWVVGSLSQFTTQPRNEGESKTHTRIRATMIQPLTGSAAPAGGGIQPPVAPSMDDDPWNIPPGDAGRF